MLETPMNIKVLSIESQQNHNTKLVQSQQITMSVDETMAALSIGRTMVYSLLRSNALVSVKIGKKRLITRQSCVDYVNDLVSYGIGQLGGE
jgi:excisionase family DNA binding protein